MTWKNSLAAALLLSPLMVACGEKTTDDPDTDTDTDAGTSAPDYFEPDFVSFSGIFGYDAVNNQARSYFLPDGTENPIFFEARLFNSDEYDPNDDFTYCVVQFVTSELTTEGSFVATANTAEAGIAAFGFALPASAQVGSTCGDFDFDPAVWGSGDDAAATIAAWTFGMGIGALDSDVGSAIESQVVGQLGQDAWDADWAPYMVGGGIYWDALNIEGSPYPGGYVNIDFATGSAVDDSFTLTYDDTNDNGSYDPPTQTTAGDELIALDASDINDGSVPSGAYALQAAYVLPADCLRGLDQCPAGR